MTTSNPTARGRWKDAWQQVVPEPELLELSNAHLVGPFDHTGYRGWFEAGPPEAAVSREASPDFGATYTGKHGESVGWRRMESLDSAFPQPIEISAWMPSSPWTVWYLYAEIEVDDAQMAHLQVGAPAVISAWVNGDAVLAPTFPSQANIEDQRALIALSPGVNHLLLKLAYRGDTWSLMPQVATYGTPKQVVGGIQSIVAGAPDATTRMVAHYRLVEAYATLGNERRTERALDALVEDPLATDWDVAWADAVRAQHAATGSFLPLHDVGQSYEPVTSVEAYETFWPQSSQPAEELWVLDVSAMTPEEEFAMSVLQGLVNRDQPRLYLLHTRYARQDRQWLDELEYAGYASRSVTLEEVWDAFGDEIEGAVLYDGAIMDEIGAYRSDRLNQTNVLMMIGSLENAVPLTPEMNAALELPVVFDGRGQWANQYDMMRWAYSELFPRMNQRILATNYPGIFLITDYLVQHQIFTFWFPEHRTLPEQNLLRGILASTPPNTPIVGWWFDWMPNPKDPEHRAADAVMETPGLLRGSYFGKVLTPSHEATNLSVHSGVEVGSWVHKTPPTPEFDPEKVYYAHVISDGDNLGEALMMRTRDLQWDKPERGSVPMGWSFAPAAARMAPPVFNYYMRTASENDLLVGGLGVGYTEPLIYLRAYPEAREELYATYAAMTNEAMGWIDTTCLWLIHGTATQEDRYARASDGQLKGIFTGYGGGPEQASVRVGPNDVVAFRSATSFAHNKSREELIELMVSEIRQAAEGEARPYFIEAWVLNWSWSMDMLLEVQERLGAEYVAVRPDVLVDMAQSHLER